MNRPSASVIRKVAQVVFIVVLVGTAFVTGRRMDGLRADVSTNAESVEKVEQILADVCRAAPDRNVNQSGRGPECRLAEAGNIEAAVPVVQPQIRVERVSRQQIEQVVDAYLRDRLKDLPAQYRAELRLAVVDYLRINPPPPGPSGKPGAPGKPGPLPTPAQIAPVVAAYVAANPPPAGKPGEKGAQGEQGQRGLEGETGRQGDQGPQGEQGVSVTGAVLDGCELVLTFSNGTDVRVGPICGKDGADGAQGPPGRGIADQDCVPGDDIDQDGDGTPAATDWLIIYDKPDAAGDTTKRIDGPCRVPAQSGSLSGLRGR